MADRFLKLAQARLVFALATLPVLPLIAFLLVMAAALAHLFLLPAREAAIEDSERRLAGFERSARRALIERQADQVSSPEDTRQRLLERFPGEAQLNAELGRLIALASEQGLQLPSGDYRLMPGKDGLFDRYVLNLPVKGSYRTIRAYLAAVRTEFPDLAIDDVSLRRESVASPEVEAQLRFILFGRRSAT